MARSAGKHARHYFGQCLRQPQADLLAAPARTDVFQ